MSKLIKVFTTLRNNWKKSVFFAGLTGWGINYARNQYLEFNLMRTYCEEARNFGREKMYHLATPRHVTVLLNPVSNKGKGKKDYDKYVQPLLHLAGLKVSLVITEAEGQAKDLMEIMNNTDCVLIAGGDGTVHEAVTGLLRRIDSNQASQRFPIGIVPIGRNNRIAHKLHNNLRNEVRAKVLAESTMTLVRQVLSDVDVVKIEGEHGRPVYFLDRINFGQINSAMSKLDQYWYLGNRMKPYLTLFFQSFKDLSTEWDEKEQLEITYTDPCQGCSNCYQRFASNLPQNSQSEDQPSVSRKGWKFFLPQLNPKQAEIAIPKNEVLEKMKLVINEHCEIEKTDIVKAKNIIIENDLNGQESQLNMIIHSEALTQKQFITEGIRLCRDETFSGKSESYHMLRAKEFIIKILNVEDKIEDLSNVIHPTVIDNSNEDYNLTEENKKDLRREGKWISIDNEYFEFQSKLKISLLPQKIQIYH